MSALDQLPAVQRDLRTLIAAGIYTEAKHPRHPKGIREGGRFRPVRPAWFRDVKGRTVTVIGERGKYMVVRDADTGEEREMTRTEVAVGLDAIHKKSGPVTQGVPFKPRAGTPPPIDTRRTYTLAQREQQMSVRLDDLREELEHMMAPVGARGDRDAFLAAARQYAYLRWPTKVEGSR